MQRSSTRVQAISAHLKHFRTTARASKRRQNGFPAHGAGRNSSSNLGPGAGGGLRAGSPGHSRGRGSQRSDPWTVETCASAMRAHASGATSGELLNSRSRRSTRVSLWTPPPASGSHRRHRLRNSPAHGKGSRLHDTTAPTSTAMGVRDGKGALVVVQ